MLWKQEKQYAGKTIRYYVTAGRFGTYSIGIADGTDEVIAPDFSTSFAETVRLTNHLANRLVMPVSLREVIEDYFGTMGL